MMDEIARFDAALDPSDTAPGRLTRAYIRAVLVPAEDEVAVRESLALITQLMTLPAVAGLARADAERLDAARTADGLFADVLALVVAAADGMSSAPLWGASTQTPALRRLTERLLHLTRHPELWAEQDWPPRAQ